MRVLICGSRVWEDQPRMTEVLDATHAVKPFTCVIEGEARGADRMAEQWAVAKGIPVEKYPADWKALPQAAGLVRNTKMLMEGKPDLVIAFSKDLPNSKGTSNMIAQAQRAGVEVLVFS